MSYPNYGPPPYGPPLTHPQGTTILVLGILGLVACMFVAPFAWVMGNTAIREIDGSGQFYENRGVVQAGRICGIIGTAILGLTLAVVLLMIVVAILASL